jgi:2-polyprenyl-3-methyl-5-hydroxy-6-metoxy-1,4-benzoquinol methylase
MDNAQQTGSRGCPACGSSRVAEKGRKNQFSMLGCKACGTLFTSVLPAGGDTQDYEEYYNEENLTVPDFIHRRLDEIVAGFAPYRRNNRFLDVGCGAGSMLQAAVRAGWDAEGLEVSETPVRHLCSLGYNVRRLFLEEARYPEGHFDVVAACGVLEHVPDVSAFTAECFRITRPGGLFYATTPNGAGGSALLLGVKWSTVSPPEHLHLFSVRGMKTFLEGRGFRRPKVLAEGINPLEIIHVFRNKGGAAAGGGDAGTPGEGEVFDRVGAAYAINESFTRSPVRRFAKDVINSFLHVSRLGDELKIYAEK